MNTLMCASIALFPTLAFGICSTQTRSKIIGKQKENSDLMQVDKPACAVYIQSIKVTHAVYTPCGSRGRTIG